MTKNAALGLAEPVLVVEHGEAGLRILTLNRSARLNAIDLPMIGALEAALQDAVTDDAVRVILLRGAGRAFCAGDDVEAQARICAQGEAALRSQLASLQRISELLTLGGKPTVVAVRGWAVGAGFSWAVNCDFAVWGASAKGFLPELGFGTFVTGGVTWLLPEIAGRQFAYDVLFLGRRLTADEALAHGVAASIAADDEVEAAAMALAIRLAGLPLASVRCMKRVLSDRQAAAFRSAMSAEVEACVETTLDPATLDRMRHAITVER